MPTAVVAPGMCLHYEDHRPQSAQTVLLLHGLGAASNSWQLPIPSLVAAGYRVLAPDLRGFGQSSYPGRNTIAAMAQDIAELLRQVATGPVTVVGHSMGGWWPCNSRWTSQRWCHALSW